MTLTPRPDWSGRLQCLRDDYRKLKLDSFVVSTARNLTYLTGFSGSAGLLVHAGDEAFLLVDGRYVSSVHQGTADGDLGPVHVVGVSRRYEETLAEVLGRLKVGSVGFEAEDVSVATLARWQRAAVDLTWVPTEAVMSARRAIKDRSEVAVLRRAGQALALVARRLGDWVAEGRAEREIARDIDAALERAGFAEPAFPTIVASGPNSAHPHARPTDRRLRAGDLVVLDFGGRLDGYCGDLTRMAAVGQIKAEAQALFDAVRDAQAAALAAVGAGVLTSSVDAAARQVLETRGLGRAFLHATGHGLGLDVHEGPRIAREDSDGAARLQAGMVCTIEPGAYVDGLGGVRLEDDVLVTTEGCEVLTDAPRNLLVV